MSSDEKRPHLIERAAARLRESETVQQKAEVERPEVLLETAKPSALPRAPRAESAPVKEKTTARIDRAGLERGGLVDWDQPDNRIADEFRVAQGNLLRQLRDRNGKGANGHGNLVMITSALPGEGKSFTSVNFAAGIVREAACGVLLVDADTRRGGLCERFAVSAASGLFDLCREERLDAEDVLVPTAIADLSFLPVGSGRGGEPIPAARMAEVIGTIGRRYSDRLIIVDTAPSLLSSDAHALAAAVGQTVLVIAAGSTQQGDIEAALGMLSACPVVSLLLNKMRPWNGHSYRYYGYAPAGA